MLLYVNYKGTWKNIGTRYIVKLYIISVQQGFFINCETGHEKFIGIRKYRYIRYRYIEV
jgi:hypothetical protein